MPGTCCGWRVGGVRGRDRLPHRPRGSARGRSSRRRGAAPGGREIARARTQVEAATVQTRFLGRSAGPGGFEPRALLQAPVRIARARGDHQIEVEHLLLGTLEDQAGEAARTLNSLGVDPGAVVAELSDLLAAAAARRATAAAPKSMPAVAARPAELPQAGL